MTQQPQSPVFAADCGACVALCCVALAFDKGQKFAEAKPAGTPCRHLARDGVLCTIHDRLHMDGFSGCVAYDCLGAGQRVSQELFAGQSWRKQPALLGPMIDAFWAMRHVQEQHLLLVEAAKLPLTAAEEAARQELLASLAPERDWDQASLTAFAPDQMQAKITTFLTGLRHHLASPAQ
ncbi:MAG: hypothetical protein JKX69_03120 [Rhodobacteraceae bacterium]|nr:hypothetical protein [Paracoccaceae bacterium]